MIRELTADEPVRDPSAGRIYGRAFSEVRRKVGKNYQFTEKLSIRQEKLMGSSGTPPLGRKSRARAARGPAPPPPLRMQKNFCKSPQSP